MSLASAITQEKNFLPARILSYPYNRTIHFPMIQISLRAMWSADRMRLQVLMSFFHIRSVASVLVRGPYRCPLTGRDLEISAPFTPECCAVARQSLRICRTDRRPRSPMTWASKGTTFIWLTDFLSPSFRRKGYILFVSSNKIERRSGVSVHDRQRI